VNSSAQSPTVASAAASPIVAQQIQDPARWRSVRRLSWPTRLSIIGFGAMTIMALVPGELAPYSPETAHPYEILKAPSWHHLLGTDVNGMDVLSRIIWAPRVDLVIAVVSTLSGFVVGTVMGVWAGHYSGHRGALKWGSEAVMRGFDILQAFPVLVLALALVAVLGRSETNIILVLALLSTPVFARLTRSTVLQVREDSFVEAARCSGNSELRVMLRHVLPNSLAPALVLGSALCGGAILITAGLSFIGAGVPAPTAEWGSMVSIGAPSLYTGQWWPALFPGLAIGLAVLCLAGMGDAIQVLFDPEQR